MTLPPTKICELIRKLHAIMGSPSDKEALSARKKLSRLLAKHELSWNDLPPSSRASTPAFQEPMPHRPSDQSIHRSSRSIWFYA